MTETATLLVVDDEENNRDLLQRRLQRRGYRVEVAVDGPEALARIAAEPYDLVILDVMMPGMSGFEVLETIRQQYPPDELPVILATALTESESAVRALDSGANDYVTKPLDFPVVLARIRSHLAMSTGRRASSSDIVASEQETLGPVTSTAATVGSGAIKWKLRPEEFEGSVLREKYRLDKLIGQGSFGAVYMATHLVLRRTVAVKLMMMHVADDRQIARGQREALAAGSLHHPAAVHIHDFDVDADGSPFLVMELLEGRSLQEELDSSGALSVTRTAHILLPICDLLVEAHGAGIIHRDLKPANIFLHQADGKEQVKVVDFGLAKLLAETQEGAAEATVEGQIVGSPAYLAPERWTSATDYGPRSDIYSLGVMLYYLLVGTLPFAGGGDYFQLGLRHQRDRARPPHELRPDLSPQVEHIVLRCLAKGRDERPDARELGRAFAAAADVEIDPQRLSNLAG